jgi:predicted ATP-grasp superfamily ATP-dependent carboligase
MGTKAVRCDRLFDGNQLALVASMDPEQILVQEVVESDRPVVSVCSFAVAGEIAGMFQYEKLRQHPAHFGTGTYLRSTHVSSLDSLAAIILEKLKFTGISEIEFIHDSPQREYRVIEMNPRTWKSVNFASQCGENIVARFLRFATTGDPGPPSEYELGRYWVDLATDVPQMLRKRQFNSYASRFFECTWERTDPLPAIALWTLFPAIALENLVSSRRGRPRRVTQGVSSRIGRPFT